MSAPSLRDSVRSDLEQPVLQPVRDEQAAAWKNVEPARRVEPAVAAWSWFLSTSSCGVHRRRHGQSLREASIWMARLLLIDATRLQL